MKKISKILVLAIAAVMCVALFTACGDKSGNVKKAFEKEGYTVETVDSSNALIATLLSGLNSEQKKNLEKYEIMYCHKGLNVAVIIKFGSANELKSFLTVNDNTSAYDAAKENGTINGNCYILTLSSDAKNIFKKA